VNIGFVLGVAWGGVLALPVVSWARRRDTVTRARRLRRRRSTRRRHRLTVPVPPLVLRVLTAPRRRRRERREGGALLRDLPVAVDLVGVAVAAGCTPYLAVQLAARDAPPAVARRLAEVMRACAAGATFDDALRELGMRVPSLRSLTDTLRSATRLGAPVAPALARLAVEVRADVRRHAEARARTVPVRLCFPLVGCVLPAFALLTVAPVVLDGLHH
jgi:pilus assembly protein TadC